MTTVYAFSTCVFKKERSGFISRSRKLTAHNVNVKILVCQITGPAAARSAGPVPTAVHSERVISMDVLRTDVVDRTLHDLFNSQSPDVLHAVRRHLVVVKYFPGRHRRTDALSFRCARARASKTSETSLCVQLPTSAVNATLLAFAAERRAAAPLLLGPRRSRLISPARTALSSKPAARRG